MNDDRAGSSPRAGSLAERIERWDTSGTDPVAADANTPEAPGEDAPVIDQELRDIVRELIVVPSRTSIVGEVEAMAMMRKFSK